jgi:hypothetical protein
MEPDAEYARRLPGGRAAGAPRGAAGDAAGAAAQTRVIPCQGLGAAGAQLPPPGGAAPLGAPCAGAACARGGARDGDAARACRGTGSGAAVTAQAARSAACGARGPAAAAVGTAAGAGGGERDDPCRCGSGGAPGAAEPTGKAAAAAPRPVINLRARAGGASAQAGQAPAPAAPAEGRPPAGPERAGGGISGGRPGGCCCGGACSTAASAETDGCGRGAANGLAEHRAGPAKARGPHEPAAHALRPHAELGRVASTGAAPCMALSSRAQASMLAMLCATHAFCCLSAVISAELVQDTCKQHNCHECRGAAGERGGLAASATSARPCRRRAQRVLTSSPAARARRRCGATCRSWRAAASAWACRWRA